MRLSNGIRGSGTPGTVSRVVSTRMDGSEGHGGPIGEASGIICSSHPGKGGGVREAKEVSLQTRERGTLTHVYERRSQ